MMTGMVLCAEGPGALTRNCTVEQVSTSHGLVLTLRHPDGSFHRLLATRDGRGLIAADGAPAGAGVGRRPRLNRGRARRRSLSVACDGQAMSRRVPFGAPIATVAEMRGAEQRVIDGGVSVDELVERAGLAVAREVRRFAGGRPILVAAGPGNNGGDAYVAARHLAEWGLDVTVAALGAPAEGAAARMAARWTGTTLPLGEVTAAAAARRRAVRYRRPAARGRYPSA